MEIFYRSNIVLIGFMGSGKSSIGRRLADIFGYKFIDTDSLIETKTGKSIKKIFQTEGEQAFRQIEHSVVVEVSREKRAIISCGGGVVINQDNINALKKTGLIIYLKADVNSLFERAKKANTRPLLMVENPKEEFERIFSQRKKMYEEAADKVIEVGERSQEEIVAEIVHDLGVKHD